MAQSIKSIIANPTGEAFQSRYLALGRKGGKELLREDCRRFNIRIPMAGLSAIEKGYSRKARITYSNNDMALQSAYVALGNEHQTHGPVASGTSRLAEYNKKCAEKKKLEAEQLAEQKKTEAIERKRKLIQEKKEKMWNKQKEKMAEADSWEDLF
jgi:hypothetical protein